MAAFYVQAPLLGMCGTLRRLKLGSPWFCPNRTIIMAIDTLQARYEAAGQGHLFTFYPSLSDTEKKALVAQLEALDVERVNRIYTTAVKAEAEWALPATDANAIEPLPQDASGSVLGEPAKVKQWERTGLDAIARNEVGVLLMAGGQGTRLGSSAPKGCYDIGLPSHKSLFQYQAERVARLQIVAAETTGKPTGSVIIPWYIMTSGPTRRETEDFFTKNAFFGLDPKNVIIFEQGACHYERLKRSSFRDRNVALPDQRWEDLDGLTVPCRRRP